jgi:subtilisin family serine protease/N-acetylneuraminic acid mutarotase
MPAQSPRSARFLLSAVIPLAVIALFLAQLSSLASARPADNLSQPGSLSAAFVPDRLIVKLRPGAQASLAAWSAQHNLLAEERLFAGNATPAELASIYRMSLAPGSDVLQTAAALSADPQVEWAEPDYLAYAIAIPNDPLFSSQWALTKIAAPVAWDVVTGTQTIAIAIIDSGIDLSHPDLAGQVWVNPGETPGNGLDEDNNGYVDDVNGWDFVNDDNNPSDDEGHGTQVSGVASAATNNAAGIAGMCWGCRIMPVKVMQASGVANYSDIAAGVRYAAEKGAKVINLSLGGYSDSHTLHSAIQYAISKDAVVIAGAGNDGVSTRFYPAAYEEVLAVAGTDASDVKTAISNYGDWVDLSAPAAAITTTFMGGDYGAAEGTSFAASFTSGLAGLVISEHSSWTPALVVAQILHTADPIDALNPAYAGLLGSGRINAGTAVTVTPHPILVIDATAVNGDPLGRPTPGESASLQVTLVNDWLDATSVQGILSTTDPYITINTSTASFGSISSGGTGIGSPLFVFTVASGAGYNHPIPFNLHVSANGGAYSLDLSLTLTTSSGNQNVGGTIGTNTTWTNDKTYIVTSNVGVAPGVTLTIQAGTVVKFNGNYSLNVGGALVADGAQSQPIRFMSNTGGSWGRIYFDDTSLDATADISGTYTGGNLLRWVNIESAAQGIGCNYATPYLSHVTTDGGGVSCTLGSTSLWMLNSTIGGSITTAGNVTVTASIVSGSITINGEGAVADSTAGGTVSLGSGTVQNTTITNGGITINGGFVLSNTISAGGISVGDGSVVRGNDIESSPSWAIIQHFGHISPTMSISVTENRLVGNVDGIQIMVGLVQGNLIANQDGVGVEIKGNATVISNTFTAVEGSAVKIQDLTGVGDLSGLRIQANNFEFNTGPYDIENLTANNIPAQSNWWGTTDLAVIAQRIFDYNDDYTKGVVQYAPAAIGPILSAPAYVRNVTADPNPVGIETATFDATFSRPMDTGSTTDVFFYGETNGWWATRTSMPTARAGLGAAVAPNGKIYAVGGNYNGNLATVEEYDPATDTWATRASMPTPRSGLGVAVAPNGKVYAIGGVNGSTLSLVEAYDPATNTWTARASMPTPRSGLGVAVAPNGKIYAIGGDNYGSLSTVEEYNPVTDTWTARASMPTPRRGLRVAAANNGKIYAIGGSDDNEILLRTVEEYDPEKDTWSTRTSMPTGRANLGVTTALNGKIYAIGGGHEAYIYITTVEEYDPISDSWTTRTSMPTARGYFGITVGLNGKVYVIGGKMFSEIFNTIEEFTIPFDSNFDDGQWLSPAHYRATYDITSLVPRDNYFITVSGAVGTDGIEIAPNTAYTFTVDYAGAVGDTTPPPQPDLTACAGDTPGTLSASWEAADPDSEITLHSYAIGTSHGGTEVVNWTTTTEASFTRSGLSLIAEQVYYISVRVRNAGGLWSQAATAGVQAGSGMCAESVHRIHLPLIQRASAVGTSYLPAGRPVAVQLPASGVGLLVLSTLVASRRQRKT